MAEQPPTLLTAEDKSRIFALYFGSDLQTVYGRAKMIMIRTDGVGIKLNNIELVCKYEDTQLILKPLSEISVDHAKLLAEMLNEPFKDLFTVDGSSYHFYISATSTLHNSRQDRTIYMHRSGKLSLLYNDGTFGGSGYEDINALPAYQFLIECGYALPYKGQDLFELGIATNPGK